MTAPTPRRTFLSALAATGAASLILPDTLHATPLPRPMDDKWDMSWTDRVNGKVRAVFDSPQVSDGAAVFRGVLWRSQHKDVYGGDIADSTAVVVLRHEGIVLAMNSAFWHEFAVGKDAKVRDAKGKKWSNANPVGDKADDKKMADYNIPAFIQAGGIVLACNLAFGGMVSQVQTAGKLSADAARARATSMLVPGVILQPSGVFAVLRAQQAGCHYILAS